MIIDINIAITPNIGAESSKNKPKLKNKNPNLKIITEQEHNKCVNLFRNVNWNEVQNTSRLNVIGNKAKKNATKTL